MSLFSKDGILDSVIIALPKDAKNRDIDKDGQDDWIPCSTAYSGRAKFDGVTLTRMCIGARDIDFLSNFNFSWIHELGHAMGLPDY